jgi:hypothetical protein
MAENKIQDQAQEKKDLTLGLLDSLKKRFIAREHAVARFARTSRGKKNLFDPVRAAAAEAETGLRNDIYLLLEDLSKPIVKMREAGISDENIGEYMKHRRDMGSRSDKINPGLATKSTAEADYRALEKLLGPEKWEILKEEMGKVYKLIYDNSSGGVQDGVFSTDLQDTFDNAMEDYATYTPVKYVEDHAPASIKKVIGTLDKIANPLHQTIKKAIAIRAWRTYNLAQKAHVDLLRQEGYARFRGVKTKYSGQMTPSSPNWEIVHYYVDGEAQQYEVPKAAAEYLNNLGARELDSVDGALQALRSIFHAAFVGRTRPSRSQPVP